MVPVQTYKKFLTELVRRHMVIFGPNIAQEMAASIPGLTVNNTGEVSQIGGEPLQALLKLINQYQQLSEPVSMLQLRILLNKYPDIFLEYNQPLPNIALSCSLMKHKS